jgi:BMFP domain-containing protein YqiC
MEARALALEWTSVGWGERGECGGRDEAMAETIIRQLMSRGEELATEVTNTLLANEAFVEMLKKGIAVKEIVDKQVADALKRMNVATRKDLARMDARIAALEAELEAAKTPAPRRKPRRKKAV